MRAVKLSRKIHKWVALVLGVQLFLWALSGFYMVAVDIDIIHGDMLVRNLQSKIRHDDQSLISFERISVLHPDARSITLKTMLGRPIYLISGDNTLLLDAHDGKQLSPLDEQTAMQVARYHYSGKADVRHVELLENNPPTELQIRPLPLWRVDFDDVWNSSFYIDPYSSEFVPMRHTLWRVFDFLWMSHVMDSVPK